MGFWEHTGTFADKPVEEFRPGGRLADPEGRAYRLRVEYDDELDFDELFAALLADPDVDRLRALLIGAWSNEMYDESTAEVVEALVAAADRLPNLTALFLVDVVVEENEISWIVQSDLSPIWSAFPKLEHFTIRGGQSLSLGSVRHDHLKSLVIQSGGLPREVVQQVADARLPSLEHLELYLGTSGYGGDATVDDVQRVLNAERPRLRRLGLRDSEIADAVAVAVAGSPLLERLEELDLSLGTLGDEGGRALLQSPAVRKLKRLDLCHHYLSDELVAQFEALPIEVDLSDRQSEDDYGRYVSVSE